MEKSLNITVYDYQNTYAVCEFEPKDSGEISADCGSWKVAKTKHSEDSDKKCFSLIWNLFVSMSVALVGL